MRAIHVLMVLGLLLAACSGPVAVPAPQATVSASDTAASPTQPSGSVVATPAGTTPAAGDPFLANDISLPKPTCDGTFTPEQTEGPYYKAGSPERSSLLEPGMAGTRLLVAGYVLNADCQPISGAWLDFWQADASGKYDNQGYSLRGHQLTDRAGRYLLETVVPGEYPGRTEHIHVKVQPPGGATLTSQLYFPGVADNSSDRIYTPATLVKIENHGDYQVAYYNFVLDAK